MNEPWFKKSCFRSLVDMHINNGDERLLASFDPEVYADNMKLAGIDTAYIYGSNCLGLCLFPTKTGYRHQIAYKKDIFGDTVKACIKRGIRPVGYLNNWSVEASERHPEWRVVGKDGSCYRDNEGHDGRYGVCCFNSPYRNYFLSLVREMCSTYPIEGFWVDMVGFFRFTCYCEGCRKKFREETGMEIPDVMDWESPVWKRYVKFRGDSMVGYAKDIIRTAREARPGITVSIQTNGWQEAYHHGYTTEFMREIDYCAGDFYTDVRQQALDSKFFRAVSKNQPFEYMVPRCPDLVYHTVNKPLWKLRQQAYSAFLHGGAFLCIDAIDPEGTMNSEVYRTLRKIRDEMMPYWELPAHRKGEYVNDVGLYINFESAFDPAWNGKPVADMPVAELHGGTVTMGRFLNINLALRKRHIQYDVLTNYQLDRLDRYPLIILSNLYALTPAEIDAFKEYVKNGGRLYVSGKTGILNTEDVDPATGTLRRKDFALRDVLGVSLVGDFPLDSCYLQGTKESPLFDKAHLAHPLGTKGPAPKVEADADVTVLAVAKLPVSNHNDRRKYLSAISDPPWIETNSPVLTEHAYGKGACVFSALQIEADPNDEVSDLWLDIIEQLLDGRHNVKIDAPICVEASVKKVDDGVCISMLHTTMHETRSAAGPAEIRIARSVLPLASKVSVFPSGNVTLGKDGEDTVVRTSDLPEFAVITVEP